VYSNFRSSFLIHSFFFFFFFAVIYRHHFHTTLYFRSSFFRNVVRLTFRHLALYCPFLSCPLPLLLPLLLITNRDDGKKTLFANLIACVNCCTPRGYTMCGTTSGAMMWTTTGHGGEDKYPTFWALLDTKNTIHSYCVISCCVATILN
jgi:hypothetical protein